MAVSSSWSCALWADACDSISACSEATSWANDLTSASSLARAAACVSIGLVALEDLILGLAHGRLVMSDLILERLVFLVLLDLVELDLEIVDLGLLRLEGVLVLLELHLGVLERLARFLDVGLAGGQRGLAGGQRPGGGGEAVAKGLGALVEQVEVAENFGGGAHGSDGSVGDPERSVKTRWVWMWVRGQKKTAGRLSDRRLVAGSTGTLEEALELPARTGCWSLRMALASIWRTRSRVTLKIRPTSSSV